VRYRFGSFELDEAQGELRRDGRPVAIQPKPLALLALLVRERERVVPADELLRALWPDTAVTPSSLNRAVSHARRALGDTHRARWIQSVARRGYRFSGEVIASDARPAAASVPAAEPDFVGRADTLARIRAAFERSLVRGHCGGVLISGPPGIGKTRLAERAVAECEARGALALVGRARDGEGVPDFLILAQMLRRLGAEPAAAAVLREVTAHAPELAALLGFPANESAPPRPAAAQRYLLFDAVTRALVTEARRRPLLLVIEDLQWASADALQFVEHLAHEPMAAPILAICTVRDEPRDSGHPVSRLLRLLRAQDRVEDIALAPFTRSDVEALAATCFRTAATPALVDEVFARTDGVPLFVREALRALEEHGDTALLTRGEWTLPPRALDLIRRPLERLSPAATALVSAAAVLGRDFELRSAAAVAECSLDAALDCVDEAAAAGVLETSAARSTSLRFAHALFQEAVLGALTPGARARLHLRAALHLERENAGDPTAMLSELAYHHHRALPVGDPERAYHAGLRAAQHAERLGAWEQAALHYEQARVAFEQIPGLDPRARLALALDCTHAWRLASERSRRRRSAREAFELARALDEPRERARAAIGLLDLQEWGVQDGAARAALEEALGGLADDDPELRAQLLTRLAYLDVRSDHEKAAHNARAAVELAQRAGDPDTLQDALYTLHFSLGGPEGLAERSELAREIERIAPRSRSADRALIALLDTACDRFELGDRAGALRLRDTAQRLAGARPHLGMRWHLAVYATGLALLEGRLDEVEPLLQAALMLGRRAEHPYARACANGHLALLARERGDAERVVSLLEPGLRAREGPFHWMHAVVGRAELAIGRRHAARARLALLAANEFRDIPRNLRWTATVVETAHLCAELEASEHAAALTRLLDAVADHHAVLPLAMCYGSPASHALARLAELRGDRRAARARYAEAIAACSRIGAEPARLRAERDAGRARG
jgi:DNA-binding winged helix-turn-helix (wHTH) protein/transcriptional regulator with XRE-family HTH domain